MRAIPDTDPGNQRRLTALLTMLLVLATSCGLRTPGPAQDTRAGAIVASPRQVTAAGTIRWQGGDWFLLGLNYPWHKYGNDFGANAWGSQGVHHAASYAAVDADFASMAAMGVRVVRWFLFADGRAGITFDRAGMPTGLDPDVFRDLDAALQLAEKHSLYLNLVLLDFLFMSDARFENGVQLGGHANVINTDSGQRALVERVFNPLFQRYATHPSIMSWEVMNEPEWVVSGAGKIDRRVSQPSTLPNFRAFTRLVADNVHGLTHSYVTMGSASVKWVRNWLGLGLDYYQAHYYDWMRPHTSHNLYTMRYSQLKLDRPLVVGEFPASASRTAPLQQYLDAWYANGYAGAWAWSYKAGDDQGSPDAAAFRVWATAHSATIAIPPPRSER